MLSLIFFVFINGAQGMGIGELVKTNTIVPLVSALLDISLPAQRASNTVRLRKALQAE